MEEYSITVHILIFHYNHRHKKSIHIATYFTFSVSIFQIKGSKKNTSNIFYNSNVINCYLCNYGDPRFI